MNEPTLTDLRESARTLYCGLSERRVGTDIAESEIAPTEDAQKSAAQIVADLDRMIGARKAKAEAGA